jgi:Fe-S cluster biogenesis protein NfuA
VREESHREFTRRSDRIEELVSRIQNATDPAMRAVARELLAAVIELHGVALERILAAVRDLAGSEALLTGLAGDELVAGVLSLHGIHPVAIGTRVAQAIEKTQPYLRSHGGEVELESIENGVVRVRFKGACGHCSSSEATLKEAVEAAIYAAAPEIEAVIAASRPAPAQSEFVILESR